MPKTIYSEKYRTIISKLKETRLELGINQQIVAEKLGKPQSFVSKFENFERRLDLSEFLSILEVYGKNIGDFL